eukprot:6209654-Pleurochrysis_carterae.AAC.1
MMMVTAVTMATVTIATMATVLATMTIDAPVGAAERNHHTPPPDFMEAEGGDESCDESPAAGGDTDGLARHQTPADRQPDFNRLRKELQKIAKEHARRKAKANAEAKAEVLAKAKAKAKDSRDRERQAAWAAFFNRPTAKRPKATALPAVAPEDASLGQPGPSWPRTSTHPAGDDEALFRGANQLLSVAPLASP